MTDLSELKKLLAEADFGRLALVQTDDDFGYIDDDNRENPVASGVPVHCGLAFVALRNQAESLIARVEELEGALGIIAKGKYGTCPIDGHWPPEKPCTRCGDLGFFDTDPEYDPSRDGHCVEGGARALARAALKGAAQ